MGTGRHVPGRPHRHHLLKAKKSQGGRTMTTQLMPGEVKSGPTTTEFWQTLLVQALTAIVAIGALFKSNFNLDGVQAVVPAVAVLAAALAQAYYSHSRAVVK